jgi:hypothetical protein
VTVTGAGFFSFQMLLVYKYPEGTPENVREYQGGLKEEFAEIEEKIKALKRNIG